MTSKLKTPGSLLMSRILFSCALTAALLAGHAAYAADNLLYREELGTTLMANTPHAGPTVYQSGGYESSGNYSTLASIVFSPTPAPYVQATATNWINDIRNWNPSSAIGGSMLYQIAIHGPANGLVPLVFDGRYAMWGDYLAGGADVWPQASANVNFTVGSSTYLKYSCGNHTCERTLSSGITAWDTSFDIDGVAGWFNGRTGIALDGSGSGVVTVILSASAFAHVGNVGSVSATAFIDPAFSIAPDYLAVHPETTLTLPTGVGNAVAAVPEPSSSLLFAGGLLLLIGKGKRAFASRFKSVDGPV
jgi:hypothetical protein